MGLNKLYSSWITIDPGFNTGLAYWIQGKLIDVVLIKEPSNMKKESMPNRIRKMAYEVGEYLDIVMPDMVILEGVYLFGDALRSITAARRGDLFALSYLVGAYIIKADGYTARISVQEAREWKGQLPDEVIKDRVLSKFPQLADKHTQHEYDAVGIGMNYLGVL